MDRHLIEDYVACSARLRNAVAGLTPAELTARLRPGCGIPPGPTAPPRGLFLVSVEYE